MRKYFDELPDIGETVDVPGHDGVYVVIEYDDLVFPVWEDESMPDGLLLVGPDGVLFEGPAMPAPENLPENLFRGKAWKRTARIMCEQGYKPFLGWDPLWERIGAATVGDYNAAVLEMWEDDKDMPVWEHRLELVVSMLENDTGADAPVRVAETLARLLSLPVYTAYRNGSYQGEWCEGVLIGRDASQQAVDYFVEAVLAPVVYVSVHDDAGVQASIGGLRLVGNDCDAYVLEHLNGLIDEVLREKEAA